MKRYIFFILFAIAVVTVYGQGSIDAVKYRCTYRAITVNDTTDVNIFSEDMMRLDIGVKLSRFYSQRKQQRDSILKKAIETGTLNRDILQASPKGVNKYVIYQNYPKGKITFLNEITGKKTRYIYEEDIPQLPWEILPDKNALLGYSCQKAICRYRGREYTAWFTTESVSLMSADSTVISYAYTAADGSFCLSVKNESRASFLMVSFIGYERQIMEVSHFTKGMTIGMNQAEVALREVKVNARRLYITGDTLNYAVSGFKAPQDVSIADVLRRMPGIEVSESGSIKYQGVDINKFYIEGLDLLEDKYKIASKNLRADYVQSIQILENHEPITSLRGKTFTEQAAVNLVLKDEAKQRWLGTFDLGAGIAPFLWNNRVMGMAFGKNNQRLSMYKNDNTGENLQQEIAPSIGNLIQSAERNSLLGAIDKPLLYPVSYANPPVAEKRYRFNNDHLIATNHLRRIAENTVLKYDVSYLHDKKEYNSRTLWNYIYTPDSLLSFNEYVIQKAKQEEVEAGLTFESNSNTFFLSNKLTGKGEFNTNYTQGDMQAFSFSEKYNLPSYRVKNEGKLIVPRRSYRLEFDSFTQYNSLPGELRIQTDSLYAFLSPAPDGMSINQDVSIQSFLTDNSAHITWQKNNFQSGLKARIVFINQHLGTAGRLSLGSYTRLGEYNTFFLQYRKKDIQLHAGIDFRYDHINLESKRPGKTSGSNGDFSILPSFNLSYEPGDWSFKGKMNLSREYYTLQELYPSYVFRNYKNIHTNEGLPGATTVFHYTGSIFYRNPVYSLFAGATLGARRYEAKQMEDIRLTGHIYTFSRMLLRNNNTGSYYGSLNFSKTFHFWNSRLFFRSLYSMTEKKQLINSVLNTYNTGLSSLSARIYIQPGRWFNSEYEITYNDGRLKMTAPSVKKFPSTSYIKHFWTNYFFIGDFLQAGLNQELYTGNRNQKNAYFMDVIVSLKRKEQKLTLELQNISNTRAYSYSIHQTYLQSETFYTLRQRCILIRYSFNL
jgi:GLPGLI family protein